MGFFGDTDTNDLVEALNDNEETAVALQEAIASKTKCIIDGIETYNDAVEVWNVKASRVEDMVIMPRIGDNVGYGGGIFANIVTAADIASLKPETLGKDVSKNAKTMTLILQANNVSSGGSSTTVGDDVASVFGVATNTGGDGLSLDVAKVLFDFDLYGDTFNALRGTIPRSGFLGFSVDKDLEKVAKTIAESLVKVDKCQQAIEDAYEDYLESVEDAVEEREEASPEEIAEAANAIFDGDTEALDESIQNRQHVAPGTAAAEATERRYGVSPEFKEQCWLLSNIFDLANYKKDDLEKNSPKQLPYSATRAKLNLDTGERTAAHGDVNACIQAHGDPYGFLNKLTQHQSYKTFFNMKTKDVATLQPQIKLYKINMETGDSGEIIESEQPITFDSHTRWDEKFLKNKDERGFGAGIKDFSFVYDGNNPFAIKKSISAKLNIFANNFDELFKDRGGYRYIDLALKTGTKDQGATDAESEITEDELKLNFRLKAVVGWALPNKNTSHFGEWKEQDGSVVKSEELYDAIYDSYVTLNLTPTIHEFKIDQMGRVNLVIDYFAYVEDFFDQPNFNVFFDKSVALNRVRRKLRYKHILDQDKCNTDKITEMKKKEFEDDSFKFELEQNLRSIMKGLLVNKKVNFINLSHESIKEFKGLGPYATKPAIDTSTISTDQSLALSLAQDLEKAYQNSAEGNEKIFATASANPKYDQLSFFYVSDLIDVILKGIDQTLQSMPDSIDADTGESPNIGDVGNGVQVLLKSKRVSLEHVEAEKKRYQKLYLNFKKLRILLGPVEIVNPAKEGKSTFVCFGDVPISVRFFISWLSKKVLKNEEQIYPLSKFLNDFFNTILKDFLNNETCFNRQLKQSTRLNQAVITSYRNKSNGGTSQYDEITDLIKDQGGSRIIIKDAPMPLLNISGFRGVPGGNPGVENGVSRDINYFVFFAARTQPAELMKGRRSEDEERGVFHYLLGKDSGIVKTIELSKTDAKFLKETRFEQEGYDGLEQLREVYDVNIETYSNVKAFPGTYIFVDPKGFAPNSTADKGIMDLTQYGIGGYCMVVRSEHTLGEGQANTRIQAKWVASIGAKGKLTPSEKDKAKVEQTCGDRGAREEAMDDTSFLGKLLGTGD